MSERLPSFTRQNSGALSRVRSFTDSPTTDPSVWSDDAYPAKATEYVLEREVGRGASGTVWLGQCKPNAKKVALKLLDLDSINYDLDIIIKETQTMHDQRHAHILPLYASFVSFNHLWMVMPYIEGGSALDVLQASFKDGFDDVSVSTIGLAILKALEYMHNSGRIHRDIKAANVLLDAEGSVLLADFGVTATMERADMNQDHFAGGASSTSSSGQHSQYLSRTTFVGTYTFMAPEVMEQTSGYNCSADIWSYGILLYELATGKAPYHHLSPTKVILTTLHDDAPKLADSGNKQYAEDLVDLIACCLVKEPEERPSATTLLRHRLFKRAAGPQHIMQTLLAKTSDGKDGPSMRVLDRLKLGRHNPLQGKDSGKSVKPGASPLQRVNQPNQKAGAAYSQALLSGDVAAALSLLKRLTKPTQRKQKQGLLIPPDELLACEGIAFCLLQKAGVGVTYGRGHGFVLGKRKQEETQRAMKGIRSAFRRSRSRVEVTKSGSQWTSPSYFNIVVGGGSSSIQWEEGTVEAILVIPTEEALEAFKHFDADLDDSPDPIPAYGLASNISFEVPLEGAKIRCNREVNARVFGHTVGPLQLLGGEVKPPHEFDALYKLLTALASEPEDHSAAMLGNIEDSGSTLLYRMPHWLYDD